MGKASILLVMGYSSLLLLSGVLMSDMSVQAYDNAMRLLRGTCTVRNIAIAGANMAANYIFLYPPLINGNAWFPGYTTPVEFGGGSFVVTVDSTTQRRSRTPGERRLTMRSTGTYHGQHDDRAGHPAAEQLRQVRGVCGHLRSQRVLGDRRLGIRARARAGETADARYAVLRGKGHHDERGGQHLLGGHPIFNAGVETGVNIPLNRNYPALA